MEVVAPTSVAAPCRLEDTAMERIMGTGEIFSCLQTARPTGAIISTVATLSIKADTAPANRDMRTVTMHTFPALSRIVSARRFGM